MGTASKVASVCLRIGELICASVVAGILGHYLFLLDQANANANDRIVYTVAIAGISIAFSIILMPPLKYSFMAFPLDYALFICWIVAFSLLVNLTSSGGCDSDWYWTTWGYYWGGWYWRGPITSTSKTLIGTANCATWRTCNAFVFIGGFIWLFSGLCGTYVFKRDRDERVKHGNVPVPETRQV